MDYKKFLGVCLGVIIVLGVVLMWSPNDEITGEVVRGDLLSAANLKEFTGCKDSDGGKNYLTKGNTKQYLSGRNSKSHIDYCHTFDSDEEYLLEGFCDEGKQGHEQIKCENKVGEGFYCSEGACVGSDEKINCDDWSVGVEGYNLLKSEYYESPKYNDSIICVYTYQRVKDDAKFFIWLGKTKEDVPYEYKKYWGKLFAEWGIAEQCKSGNCPGLTVPHFSAVFKSISTFKGNDLCDDDLGAFSWTPIDGESHFLSSRTNYLCLSNKTALDQQDFYGREIVQEYINKYYYDGSPGKNTYWF